MYNQISFFDIFYKDIKIDKPIRLIELFADIGSQAMALRDLDAEFESYKVVEVEHRAVRTYNAIHGTEFDKTDITRIHADDLEIVEKDKYCYLMTYSFPCQDLSSIGQGKGMAKGSGTRSSLLWEVQRLLLESQQQGLELPDVLLMENVPLVLGLGNIDSFNEFRRFLHSLGYSNYTKVLNSSDYGVPQNRERCFMVSILGHYKYEFPAGIPLTICAADLLEEYHGEYITTPESEKAINNVRRKYPRGRKYNRLLSVGSLKPGAAFQANHRIYYAAGLAPTILAQLHKIHLLVDTPDGYKVRDATSLETWRFMGFSDSDYYKGLEKSPVLSLRALAGNSIVKQVLMAIFSRLNIKGVEPWRGGGL